MDNTLARIVAQGSRSQEYSVPAILAGETLTIHTEDIFPALRPWFPLDYLEVVNNSAQNITLYLGSIAEAITIPSYMIKPIVRRSFMQFGLMNNGVVDTNVNEILVRVRRLPPDVQVVMSGGTIR